MTVVLIVLISAPQAALLLTEEQRATHTERGTYTKQQQASFHSHRGCFSSNTFCIGKHTQASYCLLFGRSYGNLWYQNNNKCFPTSGFYDYSVHHLTHSLFSQTYLSPKAFIFCLQSHNSPYPPCFPVLDVKCTNKYWSDIAMHDKLSS